MSEEQGMECRILKTRTRQAVETAINPLVLLSLYNIEARLGEWMSETRYSIVAGKCIKIEENC